MKINKHEDARRILHEWVDGDCVKSVKTIYVKGKVSLGNHYHLNKDEYFYMARGKANYVLTGDKFYKRGWIFEGEGIKVTKGIIHTFIVYPDSILLEAATEVYNPIDEIRAP